MALTIMRKMLMGLILMGAVAGVAMAADCSRSKRCPNGECCSQFGYCGCSNEYCGKGCIRDCNGCRGRQEIAQALLNSSAGEAMANADCSRSKRCPNGECCSQYGYCGCSNEYCGKGCIRDCNGCRGRQEIAHALLNPSAGEAMANADCSRSKRCPNGECCSQYGYCGCSNEYCGKGCIRDCNGCRGRQEITHALLNSNAGEAMSNADCSRSKRCPNGECCSQYGYCGCSNEYCGKGCIRDCNGCRGRQEITHALLNSNAGEAMSNADCSRSKRCPNGECCSQYGYCGCSNEYCGKGCIRDCNGCRGRQEITHALLNSNAGEAMSNADCSRSKRCPNGECCSQYGYCGCSNEYCGKGCIRDCNGCRGNRALTADSNQATYYTTYVPSSCYGFDTEPFPAGPLIAAASSDVFSNRAACGTYYEITCKGAASGGRNPCKKNPTVKVKVVDLCPGCNKNSFDLSKEAFSKIADLDAGRINISAKRVSKYHKTNEENIVEVV